jgi:NCS1 family nucleobase:cation symporter-1
VSASIPAFLVAGIVHVLLTKLVVQPSGKGGYTKLEEGAGESR